MSNTNHRNMSVDVLEEESIHRSPSIVAVAADGIFAASDLASMSVDELWNFHVELKAILAAKIAAEVRELERRIDRLNAVIDTNKRADRSSKSAIPPRRPYPAVLPKYRNLTAPFETWSGRGKQPRWLTAQLDLGKRLEDFRIGSTRASKKRGTP
jgi:DNA-binding protein H-NS